MNVSPTNGTAGERLLDGAHRQRPGFASVFSPTGSVVACRRAGSSEFAPRLTSAKRVVSGPNPSLEVDELRSYESKNKRALTKRPVRRDWCTTRIQHTVVIEGFDTMIDGRNTATGCRSA